MTNFGQNHSSTQENPGHFRRVTEGMGRIVLWSSAGFLFFVGVFFCAALDFAWKDFRSYTVETEGVVSLRTPTYAAIRLKASDLELPYAVVSSTGKMAPPEEGPKYMLGDKVVLVQPPGKPEQARLKERLTPPLPEELRWLGFGMAGFACLMVIASASWPSPTPSAIVASLFLLILISIAVSIGSFGADFLREHQRLLWWEGVLLWLGDGMALFWFSVYFTRHVLLGVPIGSGSVRYAGFWLAFLSIITSMVADLTMVLLLLNRESRGVDEAIKVQGTVEAVSVSPTPGRGSIQYILYCRYADPLQYVVEFVLTDPGKLPKLPPETVQAIRLEQLPTPIAIAYDPERPGNCWLADLGWKELRSATP